MDKRSYIEEIGGSELDLIPNLEADLFRAQVRLKRATEELESLAGPRFVECKRSIEMQREDIRRLRVALAALYADAVK